MEEFSEALYYMLTSHELSFEEWILLQRAVMSKDIDTQTPTGISLLSKDWVTVDGKLNSNTIRIFSACKSTFNQKLKQLRVSKSFFEEWWEAYPESDKHAHYVISRSFKSHKDECRKLYETILTLGEFKHEELLHALNNEVRSRKLNSSTTNELKFMKNTLNYLQAEDFKVWVNSEEETSSFNNKQNQFLL